jgi:hypothetical protein
VRRAARRVQTLTTAGFEGERGATTGTGTGGGGGGAAEVLGIVLVDELGGARAVGGDEVEVEGVIVGGGWYCLEERCFARSA